MKKLLLPALTGQYGSWRYYQIIMSVKSIVEIIGIDENKKPIHRIRSVDEVKEIYSSEINEMLQRVFDEKRLLPIKNYLLNQQDRYVNNLTVAIFGGDPEWYPIGIKSIYNSFKNQNENDLEEIAKTFGIIELTGEEILFVLDGQHRIKGLREAIKKSASLLNDQISITLISHNPNTIGKKKTRRLFTTINRYAKPVSDGESILLDEDDLSSIIVRRLIEEYPRFKKREAIALNKNANLILPKDDDKFSTVIALWTINEALLDNKSIYPPYEGAKVNMVRIRPADKIIEQETKKVIEYWNLFFSYYPNAEEFLEDPHTHSHRNSSPYSIWPIGQFLFNAFYLRSLKDKSFKLSWIKKIPDDLSNKFWHHVLWNPSSKTITGSKAYARDYVYYHLGVRITEKQKEGLLKNYRKYSQKERAKLPLPQFK